MLVTFVSPISAAPLYHSEQATSTVHSQQICAYKSQNEGGGGGSVDASEAGSGLLHQKVLL